MKFLFVNFILSDRDILMFSTNLKLFSEALKLDDIDMDLNELFGSPLKWFSMWVSGQ